MDPLEKENRTLARQVVPMTHKRETEDAGSAAGFCAVVVTYHPDESVADNLRAMVRECGRVLVVDNGSGADAGERIAAISGVTLLALKENTGVAAALNRGARWALDHGAKWMVTFDQDSRPQPGFTAALQATHERNLAAAVIGSCIKEAALGDDYRWLRPKRRWPGFFQRVGMSPGEDLADVTMVVTSGALTNLDCWSRVGGFDEKLFIDFVDTDYCLRCRAAGWRIAVSADARLEHHLGRRETRELAGMVFHPTNHPPLRHYYIARNRVAMIRRHGWREIHWLSFEGAATGLWLFRVLAFERQKITKLRAMVLGTWDGLLGRFGECPPARRRSLEK
jgi:rhamnosyltransferase